MNNTLSVLLSIIGLGAISSYILSENIVIYGIVLIFGILFFYFSKLNNNNRKENLNIIRDENKLYFYLSDDLLFSVDLMRNSTFTETLRNSINQEMTTIKNMTRKICFINFKDDALLSELNLSLKQ